MFEENLVLNTMHFFFLAFEFLTQSVIAASDIFHSPFKRPIDKTYCKDSLRVQTN